MNNSMRIGCIDHTRTDGNRKCLQSLMLALLLALGLTHSCKLNRYVKIGLLLAMDPRQKLEKTHSKHSLSKRKYIQH